MNLFPYYSEQNQLDKDKFQTFFFNSVTLFSLNQTLTEALIFSLISITFGSQNNQKEHKAPKIPVLAFPRFSHKLCQVVKGLSQIYQILEHNTTIWLSQTKIFISFPFSVNPKLFSALREKTDATELTNLLKALDGLANTLSHFRQLLGPKNQSYNSRNNNKLGHAKTKQSVAGETLLGWLSSGPGSGHN